MREKLQKIISAAGLMSRRAAEKAISDGRVTVNGQTAQLGDRADGQLDQIRIDGEAVAVSGKKIYIVLNKPCGYVTTMHDEKGRHSVNELVDDLEERVYPVGRLDINSEGLLIMTNDGDFANRLMHPSHEVEKVYRTWVTGGPLSTGVEKLRRPMLIDGFKTQPAKVEIESSSANGAVLLITIHEGRNRQVRKMCSNAGFSVKRLCRIREGAVSLGNLPSGRWRYLTEFELRQME